MKNNLEYKIEKNDWKYPEAESTKLLISKGKLWSLSMRRMGTDKWVWLHLFTKEEIEEFLPEEELSKWDGDKKLVFDNVEEGKMDDVVRNGKSQVLLTTLINELSGTRIESKRLHEKGLPMDLSDIGNIIGIHVQKAIQENPELLGFEWEDFINGLNHGKSLSDKTH